jgi:hypothetical protein
MEDRRPEKMRKKCQGQVKEKMVKCENEEEERYIVN